VTTTEEQAVDSMYAALFSGDIDGALACCTDDAEYHIVTPGPASGDHPMRRYLTDIWPQAMSEMAGYQLTEMVRDTYAGLVVARLKSSHGAGVMLYRVVDGKVSDIWVINALGRDTASFF
jgi:hypothetical protein